MADIAALAGLTKRTVYNLHGDKGALFRDIVVGVIAYADAFARGLPEQFAAGITSANLPGTLDDLGQRLALAIVRPEVIALRRLLIGEAREFPALARRYFNRAPGQVLTPWRPGSSSWRVAACCRWPIRVTRPRSSHTSWPVSRWTARCSSACRHRGRTSSLAPAKGC